MYNLIVLIGRIGQTPILRVTNGTGTPVANASLATNTVYRDRDGNRQEKPEWHRLVVWGDQARNFEQIVGKGDLISVQGRLEYRTREIDGQRVQEAVIRVTAWKQLTPKRHDDQPAADPDGDGFGDDEDQPAGDTDLTGELTGELAGDTDLPADLPGDGDLLPAGDEPNAGDPPADEPTTADLTSTKRRRTK